MRLSQDERWVLRGAILLSLMGGLLTLSCGKEPDYLPGIGVGGGTNDSPGACEPGASRDCAVTVERGNGVLTCSEGTQKCQSSGYWEACGGGKITRRPDPFSVENSKFFKTFSLSSPTDCAPANPCDPECQIFEEPGPFDTPLDPGNPVDWVEGPVPTWTAPSCGVSDLCSMQAGPLDATCDPCVQSICDNAATEHCCTGPSATSWDQDCVDAVYTICGGVSPPGPPNGDFCNWGVLAEGSIRFGNGGLSGTNIGSTSGNAAEQILLEASSSGSCVYSDIYSTIPVNLRNGCTVSGDVISVGNVYLAASGGSTKVTGTVESGGRVDIRNGVEVMQGVTASGQLEMAAGPGTLVTGDVYVGSLRMESNARINGDVRSAGNVTGNAGATINGTAELNGGSTVTTVSVTGGWTNGGTVAVPPAPTVEIPVVSDLTRDLTTECAAAAAKGPSTYSTGSHTLEPGIYGSVIFEGMATELILQPGEYVFNSLYLRSGAELSFTAPAASATTEEWDISACGQFIAEDTYSLQIDATGAPPATSQLTIYAAGAPPYAVNYRNGAIYWGNGNDFDATLIAPNGRIFLGNSVKLDGFLWGQSVYTETNTVVNEGGKPECETNDLWGATCPGYGLYDDTSTAYLAGDEVHSGGLVYRCLDAAKCNLGGGYDGGSGYWPGRGMEWTEAWDQFTSCTSPTLPDPSGGGGPAVDCPVDLSETGQLWSTPCATGRDCQVDHRCSQVYTGSSCQHSICEEGVFMDLDCNPCVQLVCDPDGDGVTTDPCCTNAPGVTEWDASCVARAQEVCDVACDIDEGCEHDLCAEGGGIVANPTCHSCVGEVCAARPSCCTEDGDASSDEWDASCVSLVHAACGTEGESICDFAAFGDVDVVSGNGCSVVGGALGGDDDGLNLDYGCTVQNVYAHSAVNLYDTTAGDVYSMSTITSNGTSTTSSSNPSTLWTVPSVPTKTFSCSTDALDDRDFGSADGTHLLAPGDYRTVALADDGSGADNAIELSPGTYTMDSLTLGSGTKLLLPTSGTVVLDVCGDVSLGDGVVFEGAGGTLVPSDAVRFRVHVNGTTGVTVGEGATVVGVFVAPHGSVVLSAPGATVPTVLFGLAWADFVEFHDLSRIEATGVSGAACHAAGLGETPPATCPVFTPTGTTVDESGLCVPNLDGQGHCGGVDLTLGAPCEDSIPICNRGDATFSGSVDLTFWPELQKQMATETPDLGSALGTCAFSGTIEPGDCVSHDCGSTGFLDRTLTVMVNAPDSMGNFPVAECSVLDNWTVFVDGETCSDVCLNPPCEPGLSSLTMVEDYVAECPDQMAPLWSGVGWDATLPGNTSIRFEATADPTMMSYTTLGTITSAEETCSVNAGCAFDLSDSLDLGTKNHPETIYLRLTLMPDGTDVATLNDWDVTYTCQYDQ